MSLVDVATGRTIVELQSVPPGLFTFSLSRDGSYVATGLGKTGKVSVWNAATGELLFTTKEKHDGYIMGIAFSPDHRWLATTGHDRVVRLWDMTNGSLKHALRGFRKRVDFVAFCSNDRLITSSRDGNLKWWDVVTGLETLTVSSPTSSRNYAPHIQLSDDGASLAIRYQAYVSIYDLRPVPTSRANAGGSVPPAPGAGGGFF